MKHLSYTGAGELDQTVAMPLLVEHYFPPPYIGQCPMRLNFSGFGTYRSSLDLAIVNNMGFLALPLSSIKLFGIELSFLFVSLLWCFCICFRIRFLAG